MYGCALAVRMTGPQTFSSLAEMKCLLEPRWCLRVAGAHFKVHPRMFSFLFHMLAQVSLLWPCFWSLPYLLQEKTVLIIFPRSPRYVAVSLI